MFASYPLPMAFGPGLLGVACVLIAAIVIFATILAIAAGIAASIEHTRWNRKVSKYVVDKWQNMSVGKFCSTAYSSWKDKYCPLIAIVETAEKEDI